MGREIKRVAMDFDWPFSMIWKGYHNPYRAMKCEECDGSGWSPEYKQLLDTWYGWRNELTEDEVAALVESNRLMNFTHVPRNDEQREIVRKKQADGGNSWLPEPNGYVPSAAEVNAWAQTSTIAHDWINQRICIRARARRLGYENEACQWCNGHGQIWPEEKYEKLCEDWQEIDPPAGDGYQLWTTTTEGTPMSPVFATPEELARWLADNNASTFGRDTATYDQWLEFIRGPGWAPTAVSRGNDLESGVVGMQSERPSE